MGAGSCAAVLAPEMTAWIAGRAWRLSTVGVTAVAILGGGAYVVPDQKPHSSYDNVPEIMIEDMPGGVVDTDFDGMSTGKAQNFAEIFV